MLAPSAAFAQCPTCVNAVTVPQTAYAYTATPVMDASVAEPTSQGFISLSLSGVDPGYTVTNGNYTAWCGAWWNSPIMNTPNYAGTPGSLYSTYSPTFPAGFAPLVGNVNMVNYILNHKTGTIRDVQSAIWLVTTGMVDLLNPATPTAVALANAAMANPAYVPDAGGVMAIFVAVDDVLAPDAGSAGFMLQNMIFEVTVPSLTITSTCVQVTGTQGQAITPVTLTSSGGAGGPYHYSATGLPNGITLTDGGLLSGIPMASGTFNYTVTRKDKAGNSSVQTCSMTISAPPATNTCGLSWGYWKTHVSAWKLSSMVLGGQTYTSAELQNLLGLAVKGDASINLAHELIAARLNVANGTNIATANGKLDAADALLKQFSGKLPYNVASSCGVGSDMTSVAASLDDFNADGLLQPGCTASGAPSTPVTISKPTATGRVGTGYSSSLVTTGVGPYTYSITAGSLPNGVSLNPTTGTLIGTPTVAGTFTFTAKVVDNGQAGTSATVTASITIAAPATKLTLACPSASAQAGSPYSSSIAASGGTGMLTYSISGELPDGFRLNAGTGLISGTAEEARTATFTVKVTDSGSKATATQACTIAITYPPAPKNTCGQTWSYWKAHVSSWPKTSLTIGKQTYKLADLINLLGSAVGDDQSINLAHELIGAKLNVLNGRDPSKAGENLSRADALLGLYSGSLPYKVNSGSVMGKEMVNFANSLDDFNSAGESEHGCSVKGSGSDHESESEHDH